MVTRSKKYMPATVLAAALWSVACGGGSIDGPNDAGADSGAGGRLKVITSNGDNGTTILTPAELAAARGDGGRDQGGDGGGGAQLADAGADAAAGPECTTAADCPGQCFVVRPFYTDCCSAAGACGCNRNDGPCE